MQKESKLGHNNPPKTVDDMVNDQGRINLSNSILKKLERKVDDEGNYVETVFSDTEILGLKAKVNKGGSVTLFYQYYDKTKKRENPRAINKNGKKTREFGGTVKQVIGRFPEWKIEAARSLADKMKQGIKLGIDPRTTAEANKGIPTLADVITLWKKDVLEVSNAFRESTKEDFEARFRLWIYLKPQQLKLQNYVLSHRSALNIKAKQVHLITHDDMVKYHKIITNNKAPYQANRIIADLKLIIKWAMKKKKWKITENFAALSYKTELNPEASRIDLHSPYTASEFKMIRKEILKQAIFRVIKKGKQRKAYARNFPALMGILAAGFCGRRYRDEVLSRPWSKIDTNKIILEKSKNSRVPTSYKKTRYLSWVFKQLKEFGRMKFKETGLVRYHPIKGYAFPSMRNSKHPFVYDIKKTWIDVLKKAGLGHKLLPVYMLRHSWATTGMRVTNNNTKAIKDAGGWKTYRMVEKYAKQSDLLSSETSEKIANSMATGK